MAKESIEAALKRFDERYYKLRLDKVILESFGNNLLSYMKQINFAVKNNETEEHIKNIVNRFLRATFYSDPKFVHIPQELRIRSRGTERCSASN